MRNTFKISNNKMSTTRICLIAGVAAISFTACKKTDCLNVAATDRPTLAAKISFVNARPVDQGINFLTYTTQVNTTPVSMNKATPYMDAQFGLVQINIQAAGNTSYLASRFLEVQQPFLLQVDQMDPLQDTTTQYLQQERLSATTLPIR